eukprot:1195142-Prorocentrum_minimum.AAC.4
MLVCGNTHTKNNSRRLMQRCFVVSTPAVRASAPPPAATPSSVDRYARERRPQKRKKTVPPVETPINGTYHGARRRIFPERGPIIEPGDANFPGAGIYHRAGRRIFSRSGDLS